MTTLIDLKKQAGLTNQQIGRAIGRSASTAGSILHGTHVNVYSDDDIQRLADVLQVTFERCWYAMAESYRETYKKPTAQPIRASERLYRAEVELREKMPDHDWRVEPRVPRPLATVEAIVLIGE